MDLAGTTNRRIRELLRQATAAIARLQDRLDEAGYLLEKFPIFNVAVPQPQEVLSVSVHDGSFVFKTMLGAVSLNLTPKLARLLDRLLRSPPGEDDFPFIPFEEIENDRHYANPFNALWRLRGVLRDAGLSGGLIVTDRISRRVVLQIARSNILL
jgi:hypothetical protein